MNAASYYSAMGYTPSMTGSGADAMDTGNAASNVGANVGGLTAVLLGASALL